MIQLRTSSASPFVRKVTCALKYLHLDWQFSLVPTDFNDANDRLWQQNPLGKIPCLIFDDGQTLYDSRVILEFIDHLAGGNKILPQDFTQRLKVLKTQALADGIMDAAVLMVYEHRFRHPEKHEPKWLALQRSKIDNALAFLEKNSSPLPENAAVDVGDIAVACALVFLDLRFEGEWRHGHPKLVQWLTEFTKIIPNFNA